MTIQEFESYRYRALLQKVTGAKETGFEQELRRLAPNNADCLARLRRLARYLEESIAGVEYRIAVAKARRHPPAELERLNLTAELQNVRLREIRQLVAVLPSGNSME